MFQTPHSLEGPAKPRKAALTQVTNLADQPLAFVEPARSVEFLEQPKLKWIEILEAAPH